MPPCENLLADFSLRWVGGRSAVLLVRSPKEGWAEQRRCLFCLVHELLKGSDLGRQPAVPDGQTAPRQCRSSRGGCRHLPCWEGTLC